MSVLLLRLAGPMQSWGIRSRFGQRDTATEPSKSGVIGLLAAALGRPRDADLDDLAALEMAVCVDREGRCMRDFHTASRVARSDPSKPPQDTVVSERFYLADADFLVGFEGSNERLLESLDAALRAPVWLLFLGRKSFPLSVPPAIGLFSGRLDERMRSHPFARRTRFERLPSRLRWIRETAPSKGEPRPDVPLSFESASRRFSVRYVRETFIPMPTVVEPDAEHSKCI